MKLFVNRGFENLFTRIVVFKNDQKAAVCPVKMDNCEFDAQTGDQIGIKLQTWGGVFSLKLDSVEVGERKDTLFFGPTMLCKVWEWLNFRLFPTFCLLFIFLRIAAGWSEWFFTGMLVVTVLSMICFNFSLLSPSMRQKMFRLENL